MKGLILVQLVYAVVVALAFLGPFGRPRRPVDWYLVGFNWAVVLLVGLLIAATGGLRIPLAVGVLVLGALDAALTLQLVIFLRSRRRRQG